MDLKEGKPSRFTKQLSHMKLTMGPISQRMKVRKEQVANWPLFTVLMKTYCIGIQIYGSFVGRVNVVTEDQDAAADFFTAVGLYLGKDVSCHDASYMAAVIAASWSGGEFVPVFNADIVVAKNMDSVLGNYKDMAAFVQGVQGHDSENSAAILLSKSPMDSYRAVTSSERGKSYSWNMITQSIVDFPGMVREMKELDRG
jgi:hypothetical protein